MLTVTNVTSELAYYDVHFVGGGQSHVATSPSHPAKSFTGETKDGGRNKDGAVMTRA